MRNKTQKYEVRKHEVHQIWSLILGFANFEVMNCAEDETWEKYVQSRRKLNNEIFEHGIGAKTLR